MIRAGWAFSPDCKAHLNPARLALRTHTNTYHLILMICNGTTGTSLHVRAGWFLWVRRSLEGSLRQRCLTRLNNGGWTFPVGSCQCEKNGRGHPGSAHLTLYHNTLKHLVVSAGKIYTKHPSSSVSHNAFGYTPVPRSSLSMGIYMPVLVSPLLPD